jgi:glycosyltransferase involved in cell wall biosynthesis
MPGLFALADVLLIHLRDDPLFRITIPHKIHTYLASGKPVLAAVAGEVAKLIQSAKAGLTCPPSSPQALAETVRTFHAMPPGERDAMARNARRTACESFDRDHLVGQIVEMLETVVRQHKNRSRSRRITRKKETASTRSTSPAPNS